jgi:mRNA-degrading endonuclease YafQ of YafQ-DinJ toxin-antitoxin module
MIAGLQHYKCANKPESNLIGLKNYKCPLYFHNDPILKGSFDDSGYEIDHITLSLSGQVMLEAVLPSITEHCIDQNDDVDNLQALCKMCHSVKTKKFLMNRNNNKNNSNNNNNSFGTLKKINQMARFKRNLEREIEQQKTKQMELSLKSHKLKDHKHSQLKFDAVAEEEWTEGDIKDKIIIELLENNFEITHSYDDFVTVSEMKKFKDKHKKDFLIISNKRFNEIVRDAFGLSQTKKGKNGTRGWIGLKQKIKDN